MSRLGLVGPSYASQSPNLDIEACINLYVEQDESGAGNAPLAMYSTPGTKVFAALQQPLVTPFVQSVYFAGGHTAVTTVNNGAGNFMFLSIDTSDASGNPPTVADTHGNIWTQIRHDANGGNTSISIWYAKNIAGGSNTITITNAIGSSFCIGRLAEYTGVDTVSPLDQSTAAARPGGGSITTSLNNELLIFASTTTSGSPPTFAAGWNNRLIGPDNSTIGDQIFPIAGTFVPNSGELATFPPGPQWFYLISVKLTPFGNGPIRGELFINGRAFAVAGSNFFEVLANGTNVNWGAVANDALPVTMAASPQQLLLASAGTAYVFDLMANTLTPISGATFSGPVAQAAICDDFFILTIQNSKEFVVSAPLNATDWITNGSAIVSVFPDNIVSMLVFQRQVWFFSDTQSVVYYDSGNIFPFDVNPNAFIEAGSAAENSPAIFNNSIAWLGADARGNGKVWLAAGYTPTRISNHAIEFAIQSYSRIDDTVGFSYQDQGHEFYCLYFPTPSVMWVYDAMTGMWHQRGFWVQSVGQFRAAHYQNHMFAFGKHLVGDWQSGNVYQMSIPVAVGTGWDFVSDAGNPIRRVRRAPHVSKEQKKQFHTELQIYVETGLGPIPPLVDGNGVARDPQLMLSWSDDGGHTFGNEFILDCGRAGEFKKRARKLQLGSSRDRVYQIAMSDPIPWRVVDGYLQIVQGTGI